MFDVEKARSMFPVLSEAVHGRALVYMDYAATAQVAETVLEAVERHYRHDNANVHRGSHELSRRSTHAYEQAREAVAGFIGAPSSDCVAFTSGTTGSLNALASTLCPMLCKPGSVVLSTLLEHHSNFVPWQRAAAVANARFDVVGINEHADLDLDDLERKLVCGDVALLACTHMSNITGTVVDIANVVEMAHAYGVPVVVDAAQSAAHGFIDVQKMGCDFLAFSGHKIGSLTGIGALYASEEWIDRLQPYQVGGGMVGTVSLEESTYEPMPLLLEAGTPHYAGALSLAAAIDFANSLDRAEAYAHERRLTDHAEGLLAGIAGLRVLGSPSVRGPVLSMDVEGVAPLDLATYLDLNGIAVRSGTGCAQPLLAKGFGVRSVARMSLSYLNTLEEVDYACACIGQGIELLRQ